MDAANQLLLSEGVCRQLGIVTYHPALQTSKVNKSRAADALVPSIRVKLIQSIKLPPSQSMLVFVALEKPNDVEQSIVVEGDRRFESESGLVLEDAVVSVGKDGLTRVVLINLSGLTQTIPGGTLVGGAYHADILEEPELELTSRKHSPVVRKLSNSQGQWRKKKLLEVVHLPEMPLSNGTPLREFLMNNHEVFSLEEGKRGETNFIRMEINTADTQPIKQPPRRMPFVVHQEVGKQLKEMQQTGVIQPSS